MIASLLIAAQLGQVPPTLELLTPPQAGSTLVYQMSGNLAGPGVPEFLLLDFQLLPIPLELPPFGVLQLAITPLLQILIGTGSGQFGIPVPPNPNFAGLVVHAQGFGFVFDGQAGSNRFTNLVSATLTAPDPQPRFVFVANGGDRTLSRLVINGAGGKLANAGVRILSGEPIDLEATPAGNWLFVLTPDRIESFGVDAVDGALAPVPGPVVLDPTVVPGRLTLSPGGNRLYLTDSGQDRVFGFGVNGNGSLSPLLGSPWPVVGSGGGNQGSHALTIDEQGRFLCVANAASNSLSVFSLAPSGAPQDEVSTGVPSDPSALATIYQEQNEPRVLVASRGADSITAYQLAPDGSTTTVGQAALATGADPASLSVERFSGGDRVYVTNAGTNTVDALILTANGQLSVPSPALFGNGPVELQVGAAIDRAFVLYAGDGEVSTVEVDPTDGALTPFQPVTSPTDRIRVREAPAAIEIVSGTGFANFVSDRVYVAARAGRAVGQFEFNADDSSLGSLSPPSASTTGEPNELAVHPSLDFLYVGNLQSGGTDVEVYDLSVQGKAAQVQGIDVDLSGSSPVWTVDVDPTGSLVLASLATIPGAIVPLRVGPAGNLVELPKAVAGSVPRGGAIDPTGRFDDVANSLSGTISQFGLDAEAGSLTPLTPPTVPTGTGPFDVACDPSGRFAYAVNASAGTITSYTIAHATGALSELGTSPTSAGVRPVSIAIHPGGRYVMVGDDNGLALLVYRINLDSSNTVEDGTLVSLGQLPLTGRPLGLRFSADGRHLFVSLDLAQGLDQVVTYDFDPTTGATTLLEQDPSASEPHGIATRDRIE